MDVICYACGKGEYPENTIEAIENCLQANSDWRIEMDLQMTKDGQVVLFHDDNLKRITNYDKYIYQVDYEYLKNLNAAHNFVIDNKFPYREKPLSIPLLSTVFKRFNNAFFLLDVHSNNQNIVEEIIKLIDINNLSDKVIIVSKYHLIMNRFKKLKPNWRYGSSKREVKKVLIGSILRLESIIRMNSEILIIPFTYRNRKIYSDSILNFIKKNNKKLWVWIHEGKKVVTVDTKDSLKLLKSKNVNGFFTSCPQKMNTIMLSK